MSFAVDHVRSINAQLDQLLLSRVQSAESVAKTDQYGKLLKSLSTSTTLVDKPYLLDVLAQVGQTSGEYHELEWFLLAKVASNVYGHVLQALIGETLPLNHDLWYWSQVLHSQRYLALYSLQTSPLRLYSWSLKAYDQILNDNAVQDTWTKFYNIVRESIQQRSLDVQRLTSPLAVVAKDVRHKLHALRRAKLVNASAIGCLLTDGFNDEGYVIPCTDLTRLRLDAKRVDWRSTVSRSVAVMDAVLSATDVEDEDFEDTFKARVEDESYLVDKLSLILNDRLPQFTASSSAMLKVHGRPSRIIRYWLPATALLLGGSTLLRIAVNRRAEITQWIRELGATIIDFWQNWVVDPTRKVIGTIRHDSDSEVSIMSKRSLEGDRESLERMVVDFAADTQTLTAAEIDDIRIKVHEGDVTPVLKAYEQELKSPLYGSIRGNLVRTLLIQVQKTKVDVEVAMRGIDNLLKSQELVFGNIDRILTGSPQSDTGTLSVKEYGLLVCEAVLLRDLALSTFPKDIYREFLQDFNNLIDNNTGVGRQVRVTDRIRWSYAKWL